MKLKYILTLGLVSALSAGSLTACSSPEKPGAEIITPQGPIKGVVSKAGIQNYKAIPYAAPPVGDLRWRPPAKPPSWSETREADKFSAQCMQPTDDSDGFFQRIIDGHGLSGPKNFLINRVVAAMDTPEMSEDCLYLNVRTPNIDEAGNIKGEALPVMVWIHGGAHQFGSADTPYYQSDELPKRSVVLVTINYRLGVFGYLAHPALSADDPRGVSGNYGTLDQMEALKWVQANIAAYGGDPDNVTIFGESAGGWSVTELMASPLAKGLFHKAIGQSGASAYHLGQMEGDPLGWISGYASAKMMDNALDLKNPDAPALRALSAEDIIDVVTTRMADGFHHVREGVVFPKNVGVHFKTGDFHAVPTLFGYNADEATLFYPNDPQPSVWVDDFPREGRDAMIASLSPHYGDISEKIVDLYGLDKEGGLATENSKSGGMAMMGDDIFGINVRYVSRQNEAQGQPAYLYHFTRVPPSNKQTLGAFHAAEIPFVFGSYEEILGYSKEDAALTDLMGTYWTNFAKTGNPNGDGVPDWPAHDGENWMQFGGNNGDETGAVKHVRKDKLDALEVGLLLKLEAIEAWQNSQTQIPGAADQYEE